MGYYSSCRALPERAPHCFVAYYGSLELEGPYASTNKRGCHLGFKRSPGRRLEAIKQRNPPRNRATRRTKALWSTPTRMARPSLVNSVATVSHRFLIVALWFQFQPQHAYFQPERRVFDTLLKTENWSRRNHAHPHRYEKGENTKQALSGALPPPTTFLCAETSPSRSRTRRT